MTEGRARTMRLGTVVIGVLVAVVLGSGVTAATVGGRPLTAANSAEQIRAMAQAAAVDGEMMTASTTSTVPPTAPPTTGAPTTRPSAPVATTAPPGPRISTVPQTRTWPTPTTAALPPVPLPTLPAPPPPASNGTGRWAATVHGISVTLRMEPVSPRAGENVHFTMTASYANDYCCVTTFYPGDGTFVPPMDANPCPEHRPSVFTEQVDHVYGRPGTFTVEVQPSSLGMCTPGPPVVVNAQLFAPIVIAA